MKGKLSMNNPITCNITKSIAVLSENDRGYTKEINFVSWNERDAKLDIREWRNANEQHKSYTGDGASNS